MEELLETLYSGIVNVRDWDLFCQKLGEILNADSVKILSINKQTNESKYSASYGTSKEIRELLFKFLPDDDPRIHIAKEHCNKPCILTPDTIINTNKDNKQLLNSSAIYKEVFTPDFIKHHLVLCIDIDDAEELYILICRKHGKLEAIVSFSMS